MKVKELIEKLKGKEDYEININHCLYGDDIELEIDNNSHTVDIVLIDEDEYYEDCDEDYEIDQIEDFLYHFDEDELTELANKLEIKCNNIEELSKDNIISKIINSEDEDLILDICEELFNYSYEDFIVDNAWRYSDYESKDIDDWTVDDHLAAWYDHIMEK